MLLTEQQQIEILRSRCDGACKRIWIASPYIGSLEDVQKIIGGRWRLSSVDCKVLTDVDAGFIRNDTFDELIANHVEIRSLNSIHAKIYIVDDWCLVTSANLTGTAFLCRFEMGIATDDIDEIVAKYLQWWDMADVVTKLPKKPSKSLVDYQDGNRFRKKFKALPYKAVLHDKFDAKCEQYLIFANLYERLTGRNPKMVDDGFTLLLEVDYFFNFLYYYHPNTPSNGLQTPDTLSDARRNASIKKYFAEMCRYYDEEPQHWRLVRKNTVQKLLAPEAINRLTWDDVKEVLDCLHCLNTYPFHKSNFVEKNNLADVKKCWKHLLHSDKITYDHVIYVKDRLKHFGFSSIYELIGWYYPDTYPLMNGNSDCGMRLFGFDV